MNDYLHSICLGNYLKELPKSMLPASHAEENGAYPFYCSSSIPKASPTWLQNKPAILMGTGGIASVHLGQEHYAFSTDTWAIRINGDELNIEYVYRLLELNLDKVDYLGFEGSGLRHLRKGFIKNLMFYVPAYEHQQKIATILASIDTAIEKTEALIHKYQQIKAGLMHDLFTRGVTADGKLRPPRDLAPELYQKTLTGWIPKEWKSIFLSNVLIQIDAGWSPECPEKRPGSCEWGILKVSAVTKGFYDPSESKALPYELIPDHSIEVRNNDVIMTRANGVAELVGVTVQVKNSPDKLMLSDKLLRLIPDQNNISKTF